jgi:hypothetical protein
MQIARTGYPGRRDTARRLRGAIGSVFRMAVKPAHDDVLR